MKRVAIYLRVSTLEQAKDWFWLDSQERILKAYIEANRDNDWELWKNLIYKDEWISWASKVEDRIALSRLKKDIIDWKIDIVLVWKIDRLFRKTAFLLDFIEELKKYNVNFVSKNESIDLNTHTWNLVLTILWAIAEMERAIIEERTTEWKISKSQKWYYVYWNVPFWYNKYNDWVWNVYKVNEKEAELVKKIFDLFVNQNMTASAIRDYLTSLKIWNLFNKNAKKKIDSDFIHYSFVYDILKNEVYTWIKYYRKEKKVIINWKETKVERPKSEWLYHECERVIDDNVFEKAQEKLKKWRVLNGRWQSHLFTWLVKCAECWKSFVHYSSKKKTSNYRCNWKRKSKVSLDMLCSNPDISEIKLLDIVWFKISQIFVNPDLFIQTFVDTNEDKTEKINSYKKEVIDLDIKIREKNNVIKNWIKRQLEDEKNYGIYNEIINETAEEKIILENRRQEIEERLKNMKSLDEIKEMIYTLTEQYNSKYWKFDLEDKRKYIDELIQEIIIWKEDIKIVYKFSI